MTEKVAKPLPEMRQDLELFEGPDDPDGSPTYTLFDPVRNRFFRLTWPEATIIDLLQPPMTLEDLAKAVDEKTTLKLSGQDLDHFITDMAKNGLFALPRSSDQMEEVAKLQKVHWFKWLLYHYLFFRIPLVKPDNFLTRTVGYVRPFISLKAFRVYCVIYAVGLVFLLNNLGTFFQTFWYFFNLQGILIYGVALFLVKVVHELSHAYVAKNFGVRVPTMGVAFLVLWPVLYTDVTDSWKLKHRTERLAISFAGVAAELLIAGIATVLWTFAEEGAWKTLLFVLASVNWISTLVMNINPAMRFDGYYILSDLWGIDNLQNRSFAMAKWMLRTGLLGMDLPVPEEGVSSRRKLGMLIYSIYTWVYRIILYTTIALFVYYKFTKVLGVILFFLEIYVFFVRPFMSEAKELGALRGNFRLHPRLLATVSLLLMVFLWFALPWPHQERFVALVVPEEEQKLYVASDGIVEEVLGGRGHAVSVGQEILEVDAKELKLGLRQLEVERALIEAEVRIMGDLEPYRAKVPEKLTQLSQVESQLQTMLEQRARNSLRAKFSGEIFAWDEGLRPGLAVSQGHVVGRLADLSEMKIYAYVPESMRDVIRLGKVAVFRSHENLEQFEGTITRIGPSREETLSFPQLASVSGGDLPVVQDKEGKLVLLESYYLVEVSLSQAGLAVGQKGELWVVGPWRSKLTHFLRRAAAVIRRESYL